MQDVHCSDLCRAPQKVGNILIHGMCPVRQHPAKLSKKCEWCLPGSAGGACGAKGPPVHARFRFPPFHCCRAGSGAAAHCRCRTGSRPRTRFGAPAGRFQDLSRRCRERSRRRRPDRLWRELCAGGRCQDRGAAVPGAGVALHRPAAKPQVRPGGHAFPLAAVTGPAGHRTAPEPSAPAGQDAAADLPAGQHGWRRNQVGAGAGAGAGVCPRHTRPARPAVARADEHSRTL